MPIKTESIPGSSDAGVDLPPRVALLIRAGQAAPSADNSQPWSFCWDGRALTLLVDTERAESGLGASHPATWIAIGACCENLSWAAARLGLNGIDAAIDEALSAEPFALRIADERILSEGEPGDLGGLEGRHTNRLAFERAAVPLEVLAGLRSETDGGCSVLAITDRSRIAAVGDLVRTASAYRFRNRAIHEWLGANLRFTLDDVARGDGLDLDTLGLPPGGRALMRLIAPWRRMQWLNRLGAYRLLARVEATTAVQCGALLCILAPTWGRRDMMRAGRLLERVWLRLHQAGLAVHPYFVLSDQLFRLEVQDLPPEHAESIRRLAERTRGVLDTDLRPAILLRIGRATGAVPRSRRLPIAVVCDRGSGRRR